MNSEPVYVTTIPVSDETKPAPKDMEFHRVDANGSPIPPVKRGRGRPKGSKNKPKIPQDPNG